MELSLDPHCLEMYTSSSQQARCLSEGWAENNLYCPSCLQPRVLREKAGTEVIDFRCPGCSERYNLKSSKDSFRRRVRDSEYHTFLHAVKTRTAGNLVLMHYDKTRLRVIDLEVIPHFFMTLSCIIPSNPTKPKSRSRPWTGCSISLEMIPQDGHVEMVTDERIKDPQSVHEQYSKTATLLMRKSWEGRGWTADVLRCVRDLRKSSFTLQELCSYENELQKLHPQNKNVQAKMRQQLQTLRDNNILRFIGQGQYELL